MRRAAVVAIALAGCGRVHFDARDDAAPPVQTDAALDAQKFLIDGGECPAGYTFDTLGCYKPVLMPTSLGWIDAEHYCEQDGFGIHLAVIDSTGENDVLDRQVPGTILAHWVGYTDTVQEGIWVDVFDRPASYSNWAAGEPGGGGSRNCALFFDDQTMATQDCATGDDFVCEYDGVAPVPAAWGQ